MWADKRGDVGVNAEQYHSLNYPDSAVFVVIVCYFVYNFIVINDIFVTRHVAHLSDY